MATIQIRDVPDPVYQKLKDEARRQHRSLAQQAIIVLAKGLETPVNPKERRSNLLDRMKSEKFNLNHYDLSDPVNLIREDRER